MTKLATNGIRALIAEDEPLVSTVIENELDMIGVCVVGKAADGQEAVHMTGDLNPDVVLMDIEMPEMNGIDAARRIQDCHPTPVVMLTVYSAQMTINQAADAGAGAYLIKPPRAGELERAILIARARFHDLLALRRANTELRQAMAHVKRLQGLLPICMFCHKIRTDRTSWERIETYISEHTDATFTHGICPHCLKHHFPEFHDEPGNSASPTLSI
jgi:AmiR/NasT family two-component response regulator